MVSLDNINKAAQNLQGVSMHTSLQYNVQLSEEFGCNVYLKARRLTSSSFV
jgi:threonine dehydratase